jgi:hypothetical protein
LRLKEEAPHAFPRTASQDDPQECGALRQGNIALIHSAPTGENSRAIRPAKLVNARLSRASTFLLAGIQHVMAGTSPAKMKNEGKEESKAKAKG